MNDFIDISYSDGKPIWPVVRQNTKGAIVKAGDGYFMPVDKSASGQWQWYLADPMKRWHYDPYFKDNWRESVDLELRGAYWFLRLNHDKRQWDKDASIERQAELFTNIVMDNGLMPKDVIVADIEQNKLQISYLTQKQRRERIRLFLDLCEHKMGRKPIIYCAQDWWDTQVGVAGWEINYKLWVANYTDFLLPKMPRAWTSYWGWQYTEKGTIPGLTSEVDLDRFGPDYSPIVTVPEPTTEQKVGILMREAKLRNWNLNI